MLNVDTLNNTFYYREQNKNDKYKMEVKNLALNEDLSKRRNHPLLSQGIRGLIIEKGKPHY